MKGLRARSVLRQSGPRAPRRSAPRYERRRRHRPIRGRFRGGQGAFWNFLQPINFGGVTNNHVVMASITELFPNPASGLLDLPGIGAAHMSIRSVAPQNGIIFVNGYIDWDRDLDVRISLFVA